VKISVITPTHLKNAFITELYHSLRTQTYENWEWVLFLNGGATPDQIDNYVKTDPRVKIFTSEDPNTNIGFNKNKAFHLATGEVLVEMDHDDLLTVDCLEELAKAYQENPDVGFVYSDDAQWHPDKEDLNQFTAACGWTARVVEWEGKKLIAHDSFPPTSRALSFIWYSPDHVRSWRASFYKSIGGHNVGLSVCDDHELMIRTYLNTKMHHIPKVLYIYRITGQNSFLLRNQQIQETTVELFKKYAWDLACKDAKDQKLHIVELGGGIDPKPGCNINIDLDDGNFKWDLNQGIPLPDNSVGVIYASHILEHLHDKHKIMSEIYRVLVDGGWAFIQVPSTDGRGAFQDPTHVSYWNENCFWYYVDKTYARFIRNDKIKFQSFRLETYYWEPREINVAVTDAWLCAVKSDKRRPHLLLI